MSDCDQVCMVSTAAHSMNLGLLPCSIIGRIRMDLNASLPHSYWLHFLKYSIFLIKFVLQNAGTKLSRSPLVLRAGQN